MPVRTVDRTSQTFLPPCVDDLVRADHPVRYVRDYVQALDLDSLGIDTSYEPDGAPRIPADMLLSLWMWSYYNGVHGFRAAGRFCAENLPSLWLCAMTPPSFSTLRRFWHANKEAIGTLFKQSVEIGLKSGLVGGQLVAVDGTTILACSSRRTLLKDEQLRKQLEKLNEYLKDLEQQIEASDISESDLLQLRQSLVSASERKAKIESGLADLAAQNVDCIHPHEPDVAVMNCEGRRAPAWNSQAAVDEKHGFVVAVDVTNEAHDCHCLGTMMEQSVANLAGVVAELFVADSAYGKCEEDVHALTQAGYPFVTARPKKESARFHRSQFEFNRSKMELICPLGFQVPHTGSSRHAKGRLERFRCVDWQHCGAGCACYGKSRNGRKVEITPLHESMQAHRRQVSRVQRQLLMRRRLKTVEPLFATQKQQMGFRRYTLRGHDNVKSQWTMLNLVQNVKIMRKFGVAPRQVCELVTELAKRVGTSLKARAIGTAWLWKGFLRSRAGDLWRRPAILCGAMFLRDTTTSHWRRFCRPLSYLPHSIVLRA